MAAGDSARAESLARSEQADLFEEIARRKRRESMAFAMAAESELTVAGHLKALNQFGWRVLEDRLWPGSRKANVDLLLVGPGGVVVVDAKVWRELELRDGSIYRGQVCEDEQIAKLTDLIDRLAAELSDTGLAANAIHSALVFTNHDLRATSLGPATLVGVGHVAAWVTSLGVRLPEAEIERIAKALDNCCPPIEVSRKRKRKPEPVPTPIELPNLIDEDELTQAQINAVLADPIEDWMTFLHPNQAKLIPAQWNGAARVRGPAGTGKTVVALHRAVYLAQRSKHPVLVTSFVKTLPRVLESLARRLSPTAADNIEFLGIHSLANHVLRETGRSINLNPADASKAFDRVWRGLPAAQHLRKVDERSAYWREEVDYVIKGRALTSFDDYRELDRVGRKTPLLEDTRRHAWNLYVAYDEALKSLGIADFNDLLIEAQEAAQLYSGAYSSVIVDEVQDLNLVGMRLLRTLAGDHPNSLLVVGDGQQAVYPGGFKLGEAGIDVKGRATVLKVNYRNTQEILRTAADAVSSDEYDDLDGIPQPGQRDATAERSGYQPIVIDKATQAHLDRALVQQIKATRSFHRVPWGDMAVLVLRRKDVEHYQRILGNSGVPTIELERYDGVTVDQVKVGTFKRAKGLDFKFVLMPGLSRREPELWGGETLAAYEERRSRQRREEYVGMTRARDGLWLGYLTSTGKPRF